MSGPQHYIGTNFEHKEMCFFNMSMYTHLYIYTSVSIYLYIHIYIHTQMFDYVGLRPGNKEKELEMFTYEEKI